MRVRPLAFILVLAAVLTLLSGGPAAAQAEPVPAAASTAASTAASAAATAASATDPGAAPMTVAGTGSSAGQLADDDVVRDGTWSWPVEGPRQVIRPFIAPAERWSSGHRGVDLAAGEVLLAPAAGVVRFAGVVVDRGVLSIDHGDGIVSSYEPVTPLVEPGDTVVPGEPIAIIEPGHCTVRCVHMGVRVDGEYANPLRWLGGVPRSVLLPTRALG